MHEPEFVDDAFFRALVDRVEDPIFVKDSQSRWIFTNAAFQDLLGHNDLVGKTDSDIFPEEQYREFYAGDRYVLEHNRSLTQEESIGDDTWALVKKTPITFPDGSAGILGMIIDITEYRSMRIEIETLRLAKRQALHDPLTDLPNRRHLEEYFLELLSQPRSRGNFVLMHLDLDGFKAINDQHGHAAGDAVLVGVANNLKSVLQTGMFAARIGGDEFVILCSDFKDLESAREWGDTVIERVRKPVDFDTAKLSVGASIGVARSLDVRFELEALLNAADIALYIAKENGRNQVQVYTPQVGRHLKLEMAQKRHAQDALTSGGFLPFYQPQIDLKTGALVGFEALARWNHPEHGILSPNQFMRFFSSDGKLDELDIAIMDHVIADAARLQAMGHGIGRIAVNISSNLIFREDLVAVLRSRVPKDFKLSLEISETVSFEDMDTAVKMRLDAVRDLGFEVEIDDFGRSQASILGVIALSPDRIKIDEEIIVPMDRSEDNRMVVKSVLQIAKSLGVEVIAEGVETQAHAEDLAELGCHIGQGYHFAPPLRFDDVTAYLKQQAPAA